MSRHETTKEHQAAVLTPGLQTNPEFLEKSLRLILAEPNGSISKWFDESAWADYQTTVRSQVHYIAGLMEHDPHSRRIVMNGPPGACWIATQWLSFPDLSFVKLRLKWHVISYYRSLDIEHLEMDRMLQLTLTDILKTDNQDVGKLTMVVGSFHEYLGE